MQDYVRQLVTSSSGASFRVQGKALDLEAITRTLGISPSHSHKMGDPGPLSRPYALDMWMLSAPLDKALPLEAHLIWLSDALAPHHHSLNSIKETSQLDIYCHYTSYVEENRLTLSPRALRIFMDLALPLDLSSLYIPDDEPDSSELAAPPTIERIRVAAKGSGLDRKELGDAVKAFKTLIQISGDNNLAWEQLLGIAREVKAGLWKGST